MKDFFGIKKKDFWAVIFLSLFGGGVSIVKLLFNKPGWGDEYLLSDKAINIALYGQAVSTQWTDCQVGLPYRLLAGWLKVWGVSHVSVCSFEVLFVALAAVLICTMALRRGVFNDWKSVALFSLLYWGGSNFTWTILDGRFDGITLFGSVALVILLLLRCENRSRYLIGLFCGAFMLPMINLYSIPLIGLFGLLLWLWPQDEIPRRRMFGRGIVCFFALITAMMTILVLQFYHHTLLRYVYLLFHHSTTASGDHNGSTVGFPACYLNEPWMIVMAMVAFLLIVVFSRKMARWGYVIFTLLIPMLMVAIGRYAFYYHWMFYVPLCVLLVYAMQPLVCKKAGIVLVGVGMIWFAVEQTRWFREHVPAEFRVRQESFLDLVSRHGNLVREGGDIIITEDTYYYPAIAMRLRPWRKSPQHLDQILHTTETRMDEMLAKKIANLKWRKMLAEFMNRYERAMPKLPEEGLLVVRSEGEDSLLVNALKELGFEIREIDDDGKLSLCQIKRMQRGDL